MLTICNAGEVVCEYAGTACDLDVGFPRAAESRETTQGCCLPPGLGAPRPKGSKYLAQPAHPYTQALLRSRAHGAMDKGMRLVTIPGSPPDLSNLPPGCAFADRCAMAQPACLEGAPQPQTLAQEHEVEA